MPGLGKREHVFDVDFYQKKVKIIKKDNYERSYAPSIRPVLIQRKKL